MDKKSWIVILAILIIPVVAFYGLTFNKDTSTVAEAVTGKPQIIKFSSSMCLECKQVEHAFKELLPKYGDKVVYTEVMVDNRNDMKNNLIKKYNVQLVPTVIMINSDGTQSSRIEGAKSTDEFEQCIKDLK